MLIRLLITLGLCVLFSTIAVADDTQAVRLSPYPRFTNEDMVRRTPINFELEYYPALDPNTIYNPKATGCSYALFITDGDSLKVIRSGTAEPSVLRNHFLFNIDVYDLQPSTNPHLAITLSLKPVCCREPYDTTIVYPIHLDIEPPFYVGEMIRGADNQLVLSRKLSKRLIGARQEGIYAIGGMPSTTTSASIIVKDAKGQVVKEKRFTGNPYITSIPTDTLNVKNWTGGWTITAQVNSADLPYGGMRSKRTIPDQYPEILIEASKGFGPFTFSTDNVNVFRVGNLGRSCTSLVWSITYTAPSGLVRTITADTIPYYYPLDYAEFEYNMRNLSAGATLNVQALFSTVPPSPVVSVPIRVTRAVPRLRFENITPPARPAMPVDFNVVLHALPARMVDIQMVLTTISGDVVKEVKVAAPGKGSYINEVKMSLNSGDLPDELYVVRAFGTNEQRDDLAEFVKMFPMVDSNQPWLVADSWGFYTQGDSASILLGARNLPSKLNVPMRVTFSITDTADKQAKPIYVSEPVVVPNTFNRDTTVSMPGSGYPTAGLPLSAQAEMVVEVKSGQAWEKYYHGTHPILMVRSPGKLISKPDLDSIHVVTRQSPMVMRLDDVDSNATAVRFTFSGTVNKVPVLRSLIPVDTKSRSAETTVDAGLLPVNAFVTVQAVTSYSDGVAGQIRRSINTKPDTLSMTSNPPIDSLVMSWDVDEQRELQGVQTLNSLLTFSHIPAQTEQIILQSYDDVGHRIDSILVDVPYRIRYDSALRVSALFPIRQLNTAQLQVRYLSVGGPEGGIVYRTRVRARLSQPPVVTAVRQTVRGGKPEYHPGESARYKSDDMLSVALTWVPLNMLSGSIRSYNDEKITFDSIVVEFLDCAGNRLYSTNIKSRPNLEDLLLAQLIHPVRDLPIDLASTRIVMYSKSLALPKDGLACSTASTLLPNPRLQIPGGDSYTTHIVSDTVNLTSAGLQRLTFRNIAGIQVIDSIAIVDKAGRVVHRFTSTNTQGDSIQTDPYDFGQLSPDDSPYSIRGIIRGRICATRVNEPKQFATYRVRRVMPDPLRENWVYSSSGWGPFEQGSGQQTVIATAVNPRNSVSVRGQNGDSITLEISGYSSKLDQNITTPIVFGYRFSSKDSIPATIKATAPISVNGFDEASSIRVVVRHTAIDLNGYRDAQVSDYKFPVVIVPLADQPIDRDTTRHEQSVLAGSVANKIMQSNYPFRMKAATSGIEKLELSMISSDGVRVDSFDVSPALRDTVLKSSEFTALRDVAQYPWPHVSRERTAVTVRVGYKFFGASVPTKFQDETIYILPRAEWLNGLSVRLGGTPSSTSIPLIADLLVPSQVYGGSLPIFGAVEYSMGSTVQGEKSITHTIQASYNPVTRQFTMTGKAPGENFGNPSISFFNGYSNFKRSVSEDGAKSGDFTALYRFEPSTLGDNSTVVANRELRMRSLHWSGSSGVIPLFEFVNDLKNVITRVAKTVGTVATLGLGTITPTFELSSSAGQLSTVNIGVDERGSLLHRSSIDPTFSTKPNDFPTSQSVSASISGGGGVEIEVLFGIAGLSCTVSDELTFASGTTYGGSISNRMQRDYPTRLSYAKWLNLEANFLWGLINISLFQGRLSHIYSDEIIPSYVVFSDSWSSIFTSEFNRKKGESTQKIVQLAKLADETPYYRPAPMLSANDSCLVSVHLEQSLLGRSGRIVLSTLDTATHSLRKTAVIVESSKGIHTPAVALAGNSGSAFVAWQQNESDPEVAAASVNYAELLQNENMRVAYYDASSGSVQLLEETDDSLTKLVDGRPRIAVAPDGHRALIVWPAMRASDSTVDVYFRMITRDGGKWTVGPTQRIFATSGNDQDVRVTSMNDGSFLTAWLSSDPVTKQIRAFTASIGSDGTTQVSSLASIRNSAGLSISDIEMTGNGKDALLLFARSEQDSSSPCLRTVSMYRFSNGTWGPRTTLKALTGIGVCREVEASLRSDGSALIVADNVDHKGDGKSERVLVTLNGDIDEAQESWNVYRNSDVVHETGRAIWDMTTAIGPRNIRYVAMQELDSTRNNRQTYKNGLQLGQSYCNAVIRAMRVDRFGNLVPVEFGNTPTSVGEDPNVGLEMALRYRIKVMDPAPNPAYEACVVPIAVQIPGSIEVKLFDAVGSYVATLYTGPVSEGIHGISFLVSDLPSGHYSVTVSDELGPVGSAPVVVVR